MRPLYDQFTGERLPEPAAPAVELQEGEYIYVNDYATGDNREFRTVEDFTQWVKDRAVDSYDGSISENPLEEADALIVRRAIHVTVESNPTVTLS